MSFNEPLEVVQNRLLQDVPLWHVDNFELKAVETLQAHMKLLPFSQRI